MSTTTTMNAGIAGVAAEPRKGFLDRLIEARLRQGEARVRSHLAQLSDGHLMALGFTTEQVAEVRRTGRVPRSFWL